jgi:hypothetical protein
VYLDDQDEVDLGHGFSLMKVNDSIRCGWGHHFMSNENYDDAAECGSYLVFRCVQDFLGTDQSAVGSQELQNGLAAFHILKPTHTLGFIFQCEQWSGPLLSLKTAEHRPAITPGQWARMREFDSSLRSRVPSMIATVRKTMKGTNVEHKNSIILMQLALEHMHPLVGGLLHVMGMEAIFDSSNRNDFREKICDCLGVDIGIP